MKTLWHGGIIYTMAAEGETVEAVLVADGKIEAMGFIRSASRHSCIDSLLRIHFFDRSIRSSGTNQTAVEQFFPCIRPFKALFSKPFNDPRKIRRHKTWLKIKNRIYLFHALHEIFPQDHAVDQPIPLPFWHRVSFNRIECFFQTHKG